jgi:hypothetical protein
VFAVLQHVSNSYAQSRTGTARFAINCIPDQFVRERKPLLLSTAQCEEAADTLRIYKYRGHSAVIHLA